MRKQSKKKPVRSDRLTQKQREELRWRQLEAAAVVPLTGRGMDRVILSAYKDGHAQAK